PVPDGSAAYTTDGATVGRLPITVDLMFDGSIIAFSVHGNAIKLRFRVDGELVTADYSTVVPQDGATHFISLDFGRRAHRHIQMEMTGPSPVFKGVSINARDSVWRSTIPAGPRVVVLWDSWSRDNAGVVEWAEVFGYVMGDALGWRDTRSLGIGGSGYLNGSHPYISRLQKDVIDHNPDIVLVTGGINDTTYSPDLIQDAAGEVYDAIRAALPSSVLIVVDPFYPYQPNTASIVEVREAVKAAADARSLPYIHTDGWLTGTGQVEAPTSTG